MKAIAHQHRDNVEEINLDVLQKWVNGEGRLPVTWGTLIEVLYDTELNTLAADIQDVKSPQPTNSPAQQ